MLGLVTQQRNDYQRTIDWIEYHSKIGFDTFIIFDDNSTDDSLQVLNNLKLNNVFIKVLSTNKEGTYNDENNPNIYTYNLDLTQRIWNSYLEGFKYLKDNFDFLIDDWVGFLDVDEYIVPQTELSFVDFLKSEDLNFFSRIEIHSYDFEPNKLNYLKTYYRWSDNFKNCNAPRRVKSFIRILNYFENLFDFHCGGIHFINEKIPAYSNSNLIRINHYRKNERSDLYNVYDTFDDKILKWII